jgi:hypothetical protein
MPRPFLLLLKHILRFDRGLTAQKFEDALSPMSLSTSAIILKAIGLRRLTSPKAALMALYLAACISNAAAQNPWHLYYSNAQPGPPGQIGLGVGDGQMVGMRFRVSSPAIINGIGGNLQVIPRIGNGQLFGALVALTDMSDFPDSVDLSTPDVLATTLFTASSAFTNLVAPIGPLTLAPGIYALVLGSDLFGASGYGSMSLLNPNFPDASTFIYSTIFNSWLEYDSDPGVRLAVYGVALDTTPPRILSIAATPGVLWPPNRRMIPVRLSVDVIDDQDPSPVTRITQVTCNEPQDPLSPGWELTGALTLNLRAERLGSGSGRAYTITVEAADASGNTSTASTVVAVPHDMAGGH